MAIFQALFVYLVGHLLDILRSFAEALGHQQRSLLEDIFGGARKGHAAHGPQVVEELSAGIKLVKEILLQFCNWFPDFSRYDVSPLLVDRIEIPTSILLNVSGYSLAYGMAFGLLGFAAFHMRQVDRT